MGFADGIHIKSAGVQLWAATFARLTTSAEAVDPSCLPCSPRLLAFQIWRKREGERTRGKRKELLITCFVWSESPCKYMNSKCRKSNLVAHWFILLFAYLPAPVLLHLRTWHLKYAMVCIYFLLFFYNCLFLFLPRLPLSPSHSCPSFSFSYFLFCLSNPSSTSLILFPLSPSDIRVYFPPSRMHDRGAGGTESKWQISLSLSLSFSPSLSHPLSCQRPSSASLPPSFQHLHILSDHIDIQICPGCLPPSPSVKVLPNHQGRKKVG